MVDSSGGLSVDSRVHRLRFDGRPAAKAAARTSRRARKALHGADWRARDRSNSRVRNSVPQTLEASGSATGHRTLGHSLTYYAAPEIVSVGDPLPEVEIAALKRAGDARENGNSIWIGSERPIEVDLTNGTVASIIDHSSKHRLNQFQLPAQLVANMPDGERAKQVTIKYADMPSALVHAILAAEDKRFFEHSGLDPFRVAKALYVDIREHRKEQGASTISMQLARNLWLGRDKSWKRKFAEALMTLHLERKLSKRQILEYYANAVYLGNEGTFSIDGFGGAAQAYFSKDIRALTLPEAALLAGLIQRPSYLNPFHHPERALERRNTVLSLMFANGYISRKQYDEAAHVPLGLHPGMSQLSEAQYFLDAAENEVSKDLDERDAGSADVYTTIDMRLQRAAERAIADGMAAIDKQLGARTGRGQPTGPRPEVALIALDPHTGEVKALCGGRSYADSQLDHIFAKRPPGSVFKPFVYAAALNTALGGGGPVLTPASTVDDSPATFQFGNQTYSPNNFRDDFQGTVTFRRALAHSLNVATVKVAEMVGYENVAELARRAGLNDQVKGTPAVALGAYQAAPFELARAYTVFANGGVRVEPVFVNKIDGRGVELYRHAPDARNVLDPRVAFLMVDMLEEVMRSGTAAGVRGRGFLLPAAGKTGTSHDGWFAGFTSQLLCLVWVGYDDYRELGLEGARSALPIWTEFMMQAARYKQYGDARPFVPPAGVVREPIDPQTGEVCPGGPVSYFIAGTQPASQCDPEEVDVEFSADGGASQRTVRVPPEANPDRP